MNYVAGLEAEKLRAEELEDDADRYLGENKELSRPKRDADAKARRTSSRRRRYSSRRRSSLSRRRGRHHRSRGVVSKKTNDLIISTCGALVPLFRRLF